MRSGRRRVNEKPKDLTSSLKKLFFFLKPFIIPIIIAVVLAGIGSICSIIGPDKIKEVTNEIMLGLTNEINMKKIMNIAIFLISLYLISFV